MHGLSSEAKVLLHLNERVRGDPSSSSHASREGISRGTGIRGRRLVGILDRLISKGLVERVCAPPEGEDAAVGGRYALTDLGRAEVEVVERRAADLEVVIPTAEGRHLCRLRDINTFLGLERPVSYWALRVQSDGTLRFDLDEDAGTMEERLQTYRRAVMTVMSDGVITPVERELTEGLRGLLGISREAAERVEKDISGEHAEPVGKVAVYEDVVAQVIDDGVITEDEQMVLDLLRKKLGISDEMHEGVVRRVRDAGKKTIVHQMQAVEDVFLIYSDGRLITHISRRKGSTVDQDIVAGMLTAVQSFMDDVFRGVTSGDLEEVSYGGYRFLLVCGKYTRLAVSCRSRLSEHTRNAIRDCLARLESEFADVLRSWNGNVSLFESAHVSLRRQFEMD